MYSRLAVVVVYAFGVMWCYQVVRRFREDVREIRELKEGVRTGVIIFFWVLTVLIAILLIRYGLTAIHGTVSFFRIFADSSSNSIMSG